MQKKPLFDSGDLLKINEQWARFIGKNPRDLCSMDLYPLDNFEHTKVAPPTPLRSRTLTSGNLLTVISRSDSRYFLMFSNKLFCYDSRFVDTFFDSVKNR